VRKLNRSKWGKEKRMGRRNRCQQLGWRNFKSNDYVYKKGNSITMAVNITFLFIL